jgi:hypothetical protein
MSTAEVEAGTLIPWSKRCGTLADAGGSAVDVLLLRTSSPRPG